MQPTVTSVIQLKIITDLAQRRFLSPSRSLRMTILNFTFQRVVIECGYLT